MELSQMDGYTIFINVACLICDIEVCTFLDRQVGSIGQYRLSKLLIHMLRKFKTITGKQ